VSEPDLRAEILGAAHRLVDAAAERDSTLRGSEIRAIGWATVELDRAERELGYALGLPPAEAARWVPGTREVALGAAARIGPRLGEGPLLILLEPDTEGRLAATLARHGEGVAAVYVRTAAGTDLVLVPALTSDPGGRPPTALVGRPPSAVA
jgi:hypothetical protein